MSSLSVFGPQGLVALLVAVGGLALIVGALRLASLTICTALLLVLHSPFQPSFLAPVFDALPGWVLVGLTVFLGLRVLGSLVKFAMGRDPTHCITERWFALAVVGAVLRAGVRAPFRLLGWFARRPCLEHARQLVKRRLLK